MIEMISLVIVIIAGVLIEYAIFASWRDAVGFLKEEGEKSVFEFLGMLNGEEGLSKYFFPILIFLLCLDFRAFFIADMAFLTFLAE